MYVRKKKIKGKTYYYIVEGVFEKEKLKQKTVKYLGNVESILERFNFWEENH